MNPVDWFLENLLWIAAAAVAAFLLVAFHRFVLAILAVLVVIAIWLFVQHNLERNKKQRESAMVKITVSYTAGACAKDHPLLVQIRNDGARTVEKVTWHIAAYALGSESDLVYRGPLGSTLDKPYTYVETLDQGRSVDLCYAAPSLTEGVPPYTLRYEAFAKSVDFAR